MRPRDVLLDTLVHLPPPQALEGLSPEDAARRVPGASHSIAELVGHMTFWQEWFIARCEGRVEPMAAQAAAGWPATGANDWPDVVRRFLDGLERLVRIGEQGIDRPVAPAVDFPSLAEYTIRDVLVHVASHNAHHLGQVITLRQMLGRWPPPSGGLTW